MEQSDLEKLKPGTLLKFSDYNKYKIRVLKAARWTKIPINSVMMFLGIKMVTQPLLREDKPMAEILCGDSICYEFPSHLEVIEPSTE